MKPSLFIVFGLPGAGKSYMADVLGKKFGYFVYDGDTDIPENMKIALLKKEVITDAMRREFVGNMINSVKKLIQAHDKLTVHQTFLKEFMRKEFLAAFPNAQFILVTSPDAVREQRYMRRTYFNLGLTYLRHMSNLFEAPRITHAIIRNTTEGSGEIVKQLNDILL